jgi:hypothetical protein
LVPCFTCQRVLKHREASRCAAASSSWGYQGYLNDIENIDFRRKIAMRGMKSEKGTNYCQE